MDNRPSYNGVRPTNRTVLRILTVGKSSLILLRLKAMMMKQDLSLRWKGKFRQSLWASLSHMK